MAYVPSGPVPGPVPRIDLSSPQDARHSIAVVKSHLNALDVFLENICRGHWQWGNNWQGTTWSEEGGASSASYYHYEGPPGQWQQEAESGPPGNWQSEAQSGPPGQWQQEAESGPPGNWQSEAQSDHGNQHMAALLERLGTDPQRAESPPLPDVHQVLQSLSGHCDARAEGVVGGVLNESNESPRGSLYGWYRDEGGQPESGAGAATSQREESAEGSRPESGAETSQRQESAEGNKAGSDGDRETTTTSSNNEGERSEASSSGPRHEETEGFPQIIQLSQALDFAARADAGADDPDAQRQRGWRIGRSDQPSPLVDGTSEAPERGAGSEPRGVEEDQRPLGPLPPGLAGHRLKRAPEKSPPAQSPVQELAETAIAKPIPIQKMPARPRIAQEEAAVPAQVVGFEREDSIFLSKEDMEKMRREQHQHRAKAKPPPHGMAATGPPRKKMPPVAKAAAAAAASTAPPEPMRNPPSTALPPSYKAPPAPLVYKQPPAAAVPPAPGAPAPGAPGASGVLVKGVKGVKAPPGPRPSEGSALPMPPGLCNSGRDNGDEARTKPRAEAKEMFQKKSGPVPPTPKALNPAEGEIEVVDV